MQAPIMLFVRDPAVLSSLQFALAIEGFEVIDGTADGRDPAAAAALVIDQGPLAEGLAALAAIRARGYAGPAIVLATNPTARLRAEAAAARAVLVEKPLLGDELSRALHDVLATQEAHR